MKTPTLYKKRNSRTWFCVCWLAEKKPVHRSTGKTLRQFAQDFSVLLQRHYEKEATRPRAASPEISQLEFITPPPHGASPHDLNFQLPL